MRSIAHAMLWELFRKARWSLIPFVSLAMAFWLIPLSTLRSKSFDLNNPEFLLVYFIFSSVSILSIISGVIIFQAPTSRLYTFPISTTKLVAWKLLPPCVVVGCIVAMGFVAANFIYSIELPILGVSLFAFAVSAPMVLFISQSSFRPFWTLGWAFGIIVGLGYWWKSRYGDVLSIPTHLWTNVTLGDLSTLSAAMALTYWVAVRSVAADRCSEASILSSLRERFAGLRSASVSRDSLSLPAFRSPAQAQFWYEYRQKGAAFPAITALFVCMFLMPFPIYISMHWLYGSLTIPDPPTVVEGIYQALVAFGFLFSIFGIFAGCYIGFSDFNGSKRQRDPTLSDMLSRNDLIRMGPFQATLPIVPIDFSVAIFRTIIRSVLGTWSVWLTLFVCLMAATRFMTPNLNVLEDFEGESLGFWGIPLTLLGPWVVIANIASIWLTGRNQVVLAWFVVGSLLFVGWGFGIGSIESPSLQEVIAYACFDFLSIAMVIGTVYAFVMAIIRKLIGVENLVGGAAISSLIFAAAVLLAPFKLFPSAYLMILAFAAMVVLPMATVPLAIAWNRHR